MWPVIPSIAVRRRPSSTRSLDTLAPSFIEAWRFYDQQCPCCGRILETAHRWPFSFVLGMPRARGSGHTLDALQRFRRLLARIIRAWNIWPMLALLLLAAAVGPDATCKSAEATAQYKKGFEAQAELKTDDALAAWNACLAIEPDCVPCLYESGWTRWSRSEWAENVKAWERVLVLDSSHSDARAWVQQARENRDRDARGGIGVSVPIGTTSTAGMLGFELVARFQNYDSHPK